MCICVGGWDLGAPSKCVSAYVWGAGTQVLPVSACVCICVGGWDPGAPSVWGGGATQEYTRCLDVYIFRIELFKRCPSLHTYIVMV